MRVVLLGLAASLAVAVPAPAEAQDRGGPGFTGHSGAPQGQFVAPPSFRGGFRGDRLDCVRRDRHRDHGDDGRRDRRRFCDVFVGSSFVGGEWALYNNRSWESDSYNDWWHDQPWRSYPRWMSSNQGCQRMWWSGGGFRC